MGGTLGQRKLKFGSRKVRFRLAVRGRLRAPEFAYDRGPQTSTSVRFRAACCVRFSSSELGSAPLQNNKIRLQTIAVREVSAADEIKDGSYFDN